MAATEYLVFQWRKDTTTTDPQAGVWMEVGTYTAASADAAKNAAALDSGDGTYAATPARSWQPSAFKVQPRAVQVKT